MWYDVARLGHLKYVNVNDNKTTIIIDNNIIIFRSGL